MNNPNGDTVLDRIAQWYGSDEIGAMEQRLRAFWKGEGRCMTSVTPAVEYRQKSVTTMLERAPAHLEAMASRPGFHRPVFWADFGTVSTPRYWGGELLHGADGNPHVHAVSDSLEEVLEMEPAPVDDPHQDAELALKAYRELCQTLGTDQLLLRTPDMQGPLNTASLVLEQQEFMMCMNDEDEAEDVHRFLGIVTEFLIRY